MKMLIGIVISSIIFLLLIPITNADTKMMIPDDDEPAMEPVVFGNQGLDFGDNQAPIDMCVSDTGITFAVYTHPLWEYIDGYSRTSFIAWNNDGTIRWWKENSTYNMVLLGVTTDNSYVYVTGEDNRQSSETTQLYLAKYDFDGNLLWNRTFNTFGRYRGHTIDTTEDGRIFVGGTMYNPTVGSIIIAFDSQGNNLWSKRYVDSPTLACWENHFFISRDGMLEKYQSNGNITWSVPNQPNSSICVQGNSVYSITSPHQDLRIGADNMTTSFNVTRWDARTGEQLWAHTIGIHNATHQEYECIGITYAVDKNESIALLMRAAELENWYLVTVSKEGTIISCENLLDDNEWYITLFEFEENDRIRITGSGSFGLGVALFDRTLPFGIPPEGEDYSLVVIVVVGVVIFDGGLILYLKKKHTS